MEKRYVILLTLLLCLPHVSFAASIPIPVYNENSIDMTDQPVQFGAVPIPLHIVTTTTADLNITSDIEGNQPVSAQQFHIVTRRDTDGDGWVDDTDDPIRTVMCVFKASVNANTNKVYYLQINPGSANGGNTPGQNLVTDENGYHRVNTGVISDLRIKETAGFNLFDKVEVNGTTLIDSPVSDGIVLISDNGGATDTYTSYSCDDPSDVTTMYNGPLFATVKVSNHLENANHLALIPSGSPPVAVHPISFDIYYTFFKDSGQVLVAFRLKNENPGMVALNGTNRNLDIDTLSLKTTFSGLADITEVNFGHDAGVGWQDTTNPSGDYRLSQEHCANGTCPQAKEDDPAPTFNYYIMEDSAVRFNDRRWNSYAKIGDGANGVMVALEYHWQNWPNDIHIDAATGLASSDQTIEIYLLGDGTHDHVFLAAAWKTWMLVYNFHGAVSQDYNFATELANLKMPLKVIPGDLVATSEFFCDRTFPAGLTTGITFSGGEQLDDAFTNWNASKMSLWDSSYSQNTHYKFDIDEMREDRAISSSSGVYNGGPMDWYGWQEFGDVVRSSSEGFGAINYRLNYFMTLHGHRNQKYGMIQLGEQMSMKTADQLIKHMPVNDSTTIQSSGWTIKGVHGGHAGETYGLWKTRNYTTAPATNSSFNWRHGFLMGLVVDWMLTGKPWYRDALYDVADGIRYNYSGFDPVHHNQFTNDRKGTDTDCVSGPGTSNFWTSTESRHYCRSMGNAVALSDALGYNDLFLIAEGIFHKALLGSETGSDGYLGVGGTQVSLWYQLQPAQYSMMLWHAAEERGNASLQSDILSWYTRLAQWFDRILDEDLPGPVPGTYQGSDYMAYCLYWGWDETDGFYNGVQPNRNQQLSDIYAGLYTMTGDPTWRTKAQHCYKDYWFYQLTGSLEPQRSVPLRVPYAADGPQHGLGWMRDFSSDNAQYLGYVEWKVRQSSNNAIQASFTASSNPAAVNDEITFDASSSTGDITEYQWDFDNDGTVEHTSAQPTTTYSYGIAGDYQVKLIVSDGTNTAEIIKTVTAIEADGTNDAPSDTNNTSTSDGCFVANCLR